MEAGGLPSFWLSDIWGHKGPLESPDLKALDNLPDRSKTGVTKSSVANIIGSAAPLSSLGGTRASKK